MALVPTVKPADTEALPVIVVAPSCAVPEVWILLSLKDIDLLLSVICPLANVTFPNWEPEAPLTVPVAVTFPDAVIVPESKVPEVVILSSWKFTLPEADLIVPVVNVISATFVPEARDKAAVVVINLSPKLIVVPSVVIDPSLTVIFPNLDPEAPVTVPDAVTSPVIVVAPTLRVPVVVTPVVSSVKAPVVFILLLVTSTLPNVPPDEPVTVPDADKSPVMVVAPAANVPVVETFSSPKLIAPDESVIEPPETVIVPANTFPLALMLLVTVKPFPNDMSPPTVISLWPRLIPLALVDVILPLLIDISPTVADVPTDKSAVTPASPVIVVFPTSSVPVVVRLLASKLIPVPEDTIEPELNVRLPTFNVLATVATPSIDVAPATDNVAPINISASTFPFVVMLPSVVIFVVPNVTVPSVSVILPSDIVVLPTLNEPAVTLLVVAILFPIVSVSVVVVILPLVKVISPRTLPDDASIVPLIFNPLDDIFPAES